MKSPKSNQNKKKAVLSSDWKRNDTFSKDYFFTLQTLDKKFYHSIQPLSLTVKL